MTSYTVDSNATLHYYRSQWSGSNIMVIINCEVWRMTEQPPLTSIIQKRCLMLFGRLARMDESADARRILTAVTQSDRKRLAGRPQSFRLATMKNDLSFHNLSVEDATELALDRPLWRLLAASGATHWIGASWTMMMRNTAIITL